MKEFAATNVDRGRLIRAREAAEWLGISVSAVYRLLDAGELREVRIGSSRRIPRGDLTRFAAIRPEGEASDA